MTAEVEKRIVEMRFENEQFEKAAGQTLTTLGKLDGILDVLGEAGADQLVKTLDTVQYRFSSFGIAAASAIENITGRIINLGASLLSAIPDKIISGGINRALNIEDAEFRLKGLGVAWEQISDDLDYAVKDTAYGLDEAAQAASILAAANINWKNDVEGASDMAHALRAISGVAAMTGSSYGDIASVLTDVAAAGRLTGDVITRLAYRGMNVTAVLAKQMNKSQEEIQKMLDEGTMTVQEFYLQMDKAFGVHATKANETYTGSLMNINAALSRIGADFIQPLHKWLVPVNNALREMFDRMRKVTKPFAEGSFSAYIESISSTLKGIFDRIDFDWLKPALTLFGTFLGIIDKVLIKVMNLIPGIRRIFEPITEGVDANGEAFKFVDEKALARLEKLKKIFWLIKRVIQMAGDTLKLFWTNLDKLTGGVLGDFIDHVLDAGAALSDLFRENQGDYWRKIKDWMEKVGKAAEKMRDTLRKGMTMVWTVISKTYTFLKDVGVFQFFGNAIAWAFEKVGKLAGWAVDHLGKFFERITDIANHGTKAGGVLGLIGEGFEGIGTVLGEIYGHLKDFVKMLLGLEEGENVFTFFSDKLKNAGKVVREVFGDIRDSIDETLSKDGVGAEAIKIATAILSVLLGYRKVESTSWALGRLERAFEFLGNILKEGYKALKNFNPAQWADDIETLLRRVSGALRAFSDNLNAKSLLYVAGAVIGLAFGLMILASVVETGHLGSALLGLATTMGILVGALFAIKKIMGSNELGKIAKGWKGIFDILKKSLTRFMDAFTMKEMAIALLAIAGALVLAAVALGIFTFVVNKYRTDVVFGILAMAAVVGILVGAMWALNKIFKESGMFDSMKFIAIGAGMLLMAVAVGILTLAIWGLSKLSWGELAKGLVGVAAGMLILVLAMAALTVWAADPIVIFAAAAMIGIAAAMLVMAVAIAGLSIAIKAFGWDGLAAMATGIILLAGALALLSLLPAPQLLAASASMLIMSVAIIGLAAAFAIFTVAMLVLTNLPWDNMTKNLDTFLVVCGMLLGAVLILTALGPLVLVGAGALALVGAAVLAAGSGLAALNASLVSLAIALNMLDGLDLVTIGKGLKEVGKGLVKIASAAFKFNFGNFEAFLYLPSLASAMMLLNDVDIAKLADKENGLPALAHALKSFGGLFGTGMALLWGDGGLLAAGPALSSLAGGLKDILPVLRAFDQMQNPDATTNQIRDLITAMNTFQYWDKKTKANMETGAICLQQIAMALNLIDAENITAVTMLGKALANLDADGADNLEKIAIYMGELVTTIEAFGNTFVAHGESIMLLIAKGVDEGYNRTGGLKNQFNHWFVELSYLAIDISELSTWRNAGANIVYGVARGISGNAYVAQNALTNLANSLQRSFTVSLRIRSPSRVFEFLAERIPMGIARGIQNGEGAVTDSLVSTMSGALNYLEELGKQSDELSPKITPVMDLSQMKAEYGQADRIFKNSGLAQFGGLNGVQVNGDAINYNMQNKDVIYELQNMEVKIGMLGKAIENLKLVMDTGLVVGALAPQMNSQLGVMAVREGRQ